MKRRVGPLDRLQVTDEEAKAKVLLVLGVLSGESTISEACRQAGVKALTYYKLEERLVRGMVLAASMPPGRRGRSKDPAKEANSLVAQTEELRQEHRRMQSLVRITRRLFPSSGPRIGAKRTRANGATPTSTSPAKE